MKILCVSLWRANCNTVLQLLILCKQLKKSYSRTSGIINRSFLMMLTLIKFDQGKPSEKSTFSVSLIIEHMYNIEHIEFVMFNSLVSDFMCFIAWDSD